MRKSGNYPAERLLKASISRTDPGTSHLGVSDSSIKKYRKKYPSTSPYVSQTWGRRSIPPLLPPKHSHSESGGICGNLAMSGCTWSCSKSAGLLGSCLLCMLKLGFQVPYLEKAAT